MACLAIGRTFEPLPLRWSWPATIRFIPARERGRPARVSASVRLR